MPRHAANLSLVDLFSGAGGLSHGFEQAGFSVVAAIEHDAVFAETYRSIHPQAETVVNDIREVDAAEFRKMIGVSKGEIDAVIGGPPCQGFSVNAPVRSWSDKRNHLFFDFLRFVDEFRPSVVVIENVPGLVSFSRGAVVESIYKALTMIGYVTRHMILCAAHYGVPQARWRTFIVASRIPTMHITFPLPEHDGNATANFTGARHLTFDTASGGPLFGKLKRHTTVKDAFSDLPPIQPGNRRSPNEYCSAPTGEYQAYLREKAHVLSDHLAPAISDINCERLKHIQPGGSWRDIPYSLLPKGMKLARRSDHTKRYGRLHPDGLSSTIMTKCDPHWGAFFHPWEERTISVREAARLQSFQDHISFAGGLTEKFVQIGNAVPPLLARALAVELFLELAASR